MSEASNSVGTRREQRGRLVAVTGASGGVGLELVSQLLASGEQVRGLTRSEAGAELLRAAGAEAVVGDLGDAASLAGLLAGAEVVQHLAAWMGSPGGEAEARRVNVTGTEQLLSAAADAGVVRVVHVSSVAYYGPVASGIVDEEQRPWAFGDPYGDTKIAGEAAARKVAAERGFELVIVRPTMIYGPRVASWTTTPLNLLKRGLPLLIGDGTALLDAVYVSDVANALRLAGEVPNAAGATFNIGGEAVSFSEFFGAYAAMLGKPLRRLPAGLVRGGARVAALLTKPLPVKVHPEAVEQMLSQARYDISAAETVLGYRPEVQLTQGMQLTADRLRSDGELNGPRTVLVVGAGSGLGASVARRLRRAYVTVFAADLKPGAQTDDPGLVPLEVDVRDEASLERAVATIERSGRTVDAAVTTVGLLRPGALESQEMTDIELQLDLNSLGPLRVARAVAPSMRAAGAGRIVNVGSTNGFLVTPFMGAYSAGKYALEAFSDALRLELKPFGVEVVLIQPGAMRTGFAERAKEQLRAEAQRVGEPWAAHLLKLEASNLWGESNAADPERVAQVVVRALLAPSVPARRAGTAEVPFVRLFSYLPDRVKDLTFTGPLGLKRPKRR